MIEFGFERFPQMGKDFYKKKINRNKHHALYLNLVYYQQKYFLKDVTS